MAREIELKIPLNQEKYELLLNFMQGKTENPFVKVVSPVEFIKKWDEYYSRYKSREERKNHKEPQVIRIRGDEKADGITYVFTIKRKETENGIEYNREDESIVENPDVLRDFFNLSGYVKYFEKCKNAYGCLCCLLEKPEYIFHLEVEKVNEFLYAEIEYTKGDENPEFIGNLLVQFTIALGLDPLKKDSRSWMKILQG